LTTQNPFGTSLVPQDRSEMDWNPLIVGATIAAAIWSLLVEASKKRAQAIRTDKKALGLPTVANTIIDEAYRQAIVAILKRTPDKKIPAISPEDRQYLSAIGTVNAKVYRLRKLAKSRRSKTEEAYAFGIYSGLTVLALGLLGVLSSVSGTSQTVNWIAVYLSAGMVAVLAAGLFIRYLTDCVLNREISHLEESVDYIQRLQDIKSLDDALDSAMSVA
jgi:hypothetical protein